MTATMQTTMSTDSALAEELLAACTKIISKMNKLDDESKFHIGGALNNALLEAQAQVAAQRRSAVRSLRKDYTVKALAELLNTSQSRVVQLEHGQGRRDKSGNAQVRKWAGLE